MTSYDEKNGYVIASYIATFQFDKAAEEVLKRDAKRPKWDYTLKEDFAFCMRNYSLVNSLMAGIKLNERLSEKYGGKLTSVFWCAIPIEVIRGIKNGMHSSNLAYSTLDLDPEEAKSSGDNPMYVGNVIKAMKYLIANYPDDPFLEYGYYYMQDYEKALEVRPNSIIKDVIVYAQGFRHIIEVELKYGYDTDKIKSDIANSPQTKESIYKAIEKFEYYLKDFRKEPLADDALYWLSWSLIILNKYDEAALKLSKIYNYGDFDRNNQAQSLLNSIIPFVNKKYILIPTWKNSKHNAV